MNNKNALAAVVAVSVAALTGCSSTEFISLTIFHGEETNVVYSAAGHTLGDVRLNGVDAENRTDVDPSSRSACTLFGCGLNASGEWMVETVAGMTGNALFELEVDGSALVVDVDDAFTARTATVVSADANGVSLDLSHRTDTILAAHLTVASGYGDGSPASVVVDDNGIVTLAAEQALAPGVYLVDWQIALSATCDGDAAPAECNLVQGAAPEVTFTVE
jgi:hypothetical protein